MIIILVHLLCTDIIINWQAVMFFHNNNNNVFVFSNRGSIILTYLVKTHE